MSGTDVERSDRQPSAARPRSRTRLIVQTSVSLVLVVAIFYYLLRGIDLALVWAEIRAMSWAADATQRARVEAIRQRHGPERLGPER